MYFRAKNQVIVNTVSENKVIALRKEQVRTCNNAVRLPMLLSRGFWTVWAPAAYQQTSFATTARSQRAEHDSAVDSTEKHQSGNQKHLETKNCDGETERSRSRSLKHSSFSCVRYVYRMYFLKRSPTTITYCGTKMKSAAGPPPCNRLFQPLPWHSSQGHSVKVTLVARPLLTPAAHKLCRCELGTFTSRTCVHSRKLFRFKIVCWCSWGI
jgi:hypothetical protein